MQIIFNIPSEKVQRIVDAINGLYPIPPELESTFSPQQWAKERVRQFIIATVHRHEQIIAINQVKESILPDNDLAT